MFSGTELNDAYGVVGGDLQEHGRMQPSLSVQQQRSPAPQVLQSSIPPPPPPPPQPPSYDAQSFNQQVMQEQKVWHQPLPLPQPLPLARFEPPSYYDRLMGKRKDVLKMISLAFIVLLGLSLHGFFKASMKYIIKHYKLSRQRQLWLRAAYPLLVILISWNQRVITTQF